jgi:hypothetical protein
LGARPWTSRTDEIIEANEAMKQEEVTQKPKKKRAPRKKKEASEAIRLEGEEAKGEPTSNSETI